MKFPFKKNLKICEKCQIELKEVNRKIAIEYVKKYGDNGGAWQHYKGWNCGSKLHPPPDDCGYRMEHMLTNQKNKIKAKNAEFNNQ